MAATRLRYEQQLVRKDEWAVTREENLRAREKQITEARPTLDTQIADGLELHALGLTPEP